jgi:adenosine deaminase
MRPHLLLDLAREHGVDLPADDEEGLRRWFRFADFEHFIEVYLTCSRCLVAPEDFQRLAMDFARQQADQNILYSEVHFTISTHLANGVNGEEVAHALGESLTEAESRLGVTIRLIPDIVRSLGPAVADQTTRWALDQRHRGVVALGIAGLERAPIEPFAAHFEAARSAGLGTTAHAGEQRGPESIREVLQVCRPERLGHGITAIRDPRLLAELATAGIPLEICPTSNVRLGYAAAYDRHPFDELREAGLALSINSDDPPLFGTSLIEEFCAVQEAFGYSLEELAGFARAAFEHAFLDGKARAQRLKSFDRETAALMESIA